MRGVIVATTICGQTHGDPGRKHADEVYPFVRIRRTENGPGFGTGLGGNQEPAAITAGATLVPRRGEPCCVQLFRLILATGQIVILLKYDATVTTTGVSR